MWNPRAFRWCSQAALGQSQSTTLILQNAYNKLFILILIFLNTNGNSIQPGMLKINEKIFFDEYFITSTSFLENRSRCDSHYCHPWRKCHLQLSRRISRRSSCSLCPSMGEEGERNGMLINFFSFSLNHI